MKQTRNANGGRICSADVEFVGGPYDGHIQPTLTHAHLPAEVVWLVCEDAFRVLDGKDNRPGGSITSVALYELDDSNGSLRYRFARAMSIRELTDSIGVTRTEIEC